MGLFSRKKAPFRGALFGMNGTLFDTERWFRQAWWNILARRNLRHQDYNPAWHEGLADRDYFRIVMRRFAIVEDEQDFVTEWRQEARLLVKANAKVCPGVRNTLRSLRRHDVQMAVVTASSTEMTQYLLMEHKLAKWFRLIITRQTLVTHNLYGKPSPDPYRVGVAALGMYPKECIVFEDCAAGVISAKAAGCRTVIGAVNWPDRKTKDVDARRAELLRAGADLSFADLTHFDVRDYLPTL